MLLLTAELFGLCLVAGVFGSLLGLGGGVIVVPALTLLFGVPIRLAIGASIVAIIATSSGSAVSYVRDHLANLRVGMYLEIGTTVGAIGGAFLAGVLEPRAIFVIFGAVLAVSAFQMLRRRHDESGLEVPADAWADRLELHSSFTDDGRDRAYKVTRTKAGLSLMVLAGAMSGLLGVGSGSLKVPAMDLAMRLPIKVSTATSNFMIGVTAAASAGIYFVRGDIEPYVAAPVAAGVLVGATLGARLLPRITEGAIRFLFVVVLLAIAVQMLLKGVL